MMDFVPCLEHMAVCLFKHDLRLLLFFSVSLSLSTKLLPMNMWLFKGVLGAVSFTVSCKQIDEHCTGGQKLILLDVGGFQCYLFLWLALPI